LYSTSGNNTTTPAVAVFELSAADEAVVLNSVELKVNQTKDLVKELAIYSSENVRLSRAKSVNSDNEASINLLDDITIQPNDSIQLHVKASLESREGSFDVEMIKANSNSASVEIDDAVSARHDVEDSDVALVTIIGETAPEVSVGEQGVKVFDFQMDVTLKDASVSALTFKETGSASLSDLANLALYMENEMVAEGIVNDNYVTFNFNSPFMLDEDVKDYDGYIVADILDGALKNISFDVESALDVEGSSENISYGLATSISDAQPRDAGNNIIGTEIKAGEITVVALDIENDETTEDRDDVILAELEITPNAGDDIEIQEFKMTVTDTQAEAVLEPEDLISNPTLYFSTTRGGMTNSEDLTELVANAGDDVTELSVTNISYSLKQGQTYYLTVRVDLEKTADMRTAAIARGENANAVNALDASAMNFKGSISAIGGAAGAAGIYIEANDERVSDVTPSSVTFDQVDVISSSVTVIPKAQADDKVIVDRKANAFHFELEASNASDITVEDLRFKFLAGAAGNAAATTATISNVELFVDEVTDTPIDSSSSFDADGDIEFEGLDLTIEADQKRSFFVYVTITDSAALNGHLINTSLEADSVIKDDKKKALTVAQTSSDRTLTISDGGSINLFMDNNHESTNVTKYIPAGSSATVAVVRATAIDEDITLEDFTVTIAGAGDDATANSIFDKIEIQDSEGNMLAEENVSAQAVAFTNENVQVERGSRDLYIVAYTNPSGDGNSGIQSGDLTVALAVSKASGQDQLAAANINDQAAVVSNAFTVLPVHFSNAALVSEAGANTKVATKLQSSNNNLAILQLTANSTMSTDQADGGDLFGLVTNLTFDLDKLATTELRNVTLRRVDSGSSEVQGYNVAAGEQAVLTVQADAATTLRVNGNLYQIAAQGALNTTTNALRDALNETVNNGGVAGLNGTSFEASTNGGVLTITAPHGGLYIDPLSLNANIVITSGVSTDTVSFDLADEGFGDNDKVRPGETVSYLVRGVVELDANDATDDYVNLSFDTLNDSEVSYTYDDTNLAEGKTYVFTCTEATNSIRINGRDIHAMVDPGANANDAGDEECAELSASINAAFGANTSAVAADNGNADKLTITGPTNGLHIDTAKNAGIVEVNGNGENQISGFTPKLITDFRLPSNLLDGITINVGN
jgi:hypothetical protein